MPDEFPKGEVGFLLQAKQRPASGMAHGNIAKLNFVLAGKPPRIYGLPRMLYLAKTILIIRLRQFVPMLEIKHVEAHDILPPLIFIKI